MKSRQRTCQKCGDPLGNTLGLCHECGGDTYRAGGNMADEWGRWWKIMLGVPKGLIDEAHKELP